MSTLLVIGGSGFFGKSILDAYQRGLLGKWSIDKIIVMARNPARLMSEAPELLSSTVELVPADVGSTDSLPCADYVIHAAASTDAAKYLSQGEDERKNIIKGTLNYCKLAPKFHKNSKIVFCSSGAVYGQQPEDLDFLEEAMDFGDAEGLSETKKAYAYAKRDSEEAIRLLGSEHSLDVSIARCFTFVGKYLPKNQHFAIGNFIGDAVANHPIQVKARHKVYRSYMYSDDLVEWLMTICEFSNNKCPIYNVGSNQKIEVHALAGKISEMFGVELISPAILNDERDDNYVPSIDKALNELSLNLKFDLIQAVQLSK